MPRLFVLSGSDLGKIHLLEGKVRIGRSSDCDFVVRDKSISRVHAELTPEGDDWVLADLDSSNGVHLGSVRAKRFELSDGDVFRLGKVELRFRLDDGVTADSDLVEEAPVPVGPAPTPSEQVDEDLEDDELHLEEDIDLGGVSPGPTTPAAPPVSADPRVGLSTGGAPLRSDEDEERLRTLRAAARGRSAEVTDRREREVLQFSTHRSESTAMTSDLSQHPLWVRILAVLLALGVSAAVFWFAFHGASSIG